MNAKTTLIDDFNENELQKWLPNSLSVKTFQNCISVCLEIKGSTCIDAESFITYVVKLALKKEMDGYRIEKATLEFSKEQRHLKMCYFHTANPLIEELKKPPFELGNFLSTTIFKLKEHSPNLCLCTQSGRSYFWRMALGTIASQIP